MKHRGMSVIAGALLASGALACGHAPPPQELIEARTVFARAAAGPASQYAPARLQVAKQALSEAELAYEKASQEEVQDRAYVAIRRAETAEAEAAAAVASERRNTALRELALLSGIHADRARAELGPAAPAAPTPGTPTLDTRGLGATPLGAAPAATATSSTPALPAAAPSAPVVGTPPTSSPRDISAQPTPPSVPSQRAFQTLAQSAPVKEDARGLVVTLPGETLFVMDQSQLLPITQSSLDGIASTLKQISSGSARVLIEGHSDATGQRQTNVDLSRRRAESVRDYLTTRGVRADLLAVVGVGPDRPIANNRTPEGRANNRRIEIIIPAAAMPLEKTNPLESSRREVMPARATEGARQP